MPRHAGPFLFFFFFMEVAVNCLLSTGSLRVAHKMIVRRPSCKAETLILVVVIESLLTGPLGLVGSHMNDS